MAQIYWFNFFIPQSLASCVLFRAPFITNHSIKWSRFIKRATPSLNHLSSITKTKTIIGWRLSLRKKEAPIFDKVVKLVSVEPISEVERIQKLRYLVGSNLNKVFCTKFHYLQFPFYTNLAYLARFSRHFNSKLSGWEFLHNFNGFYIFAILLMYRNIWIMTVMPALNRENAYLHTLITYVNILVNRSRKCRIIMKALLSNLADERCDKNTWKEKQNLFENYSN